MLPFDLRLVFIPTHSVEDCADWMAISVCSEHKVGEHPLLILNADLKLLLASHFCPQRLF